MSPNSIIAGFNARPRVQLSEHDAARRPSCSSQCHVHDCTCLCSLQFMKIHELISFLEKRFGYTQTESHCVFQTSGGIVYLYNCRHILAAVQERHLPIPPSIDRPTICLRQQVFNISSANSTPLTADQDLHVLTYLVIRPLLAVA